MAFDLVTGLGGGGGGGATPVTDWAPITFSCPVSSMYVFYGANASYNTSNTQFWTALDLQGAYLIDSTVSAYTDIVNITGSGHLSGCVSGAVSGSQDVTFEVTLDGVVREFRVYTLNAERGCAIFSKQNVMLHDIYNKRSAYSTFATTAYSTPHLNSNGGTGNLFLLPPSLMYGARFNDSLRVRVKLGTGSTYTGSFQDYHGVFYAID